MAFQILPGDDTDTQTKLDVLVAAATRESVMEHIAVLQEAGLEPVGLMAEPHAVEQLWRSAGLGEDEEGSIAYFPGRPA
jgi:Tfp pilus assembly PilM family ATPase